MYDQHSWGPCGIISAIAWKTPPLCIGLMWTVTNVIGPLCSIAFFFSKYCPLLILFCPNRKIVLDRFLQCQLKFLLLNIYLTDICFIITSELEKVHKRKLSAASYSAAENKTHLHQLMYITMDEPPAMWPIDSYREPLKSILSPTVWRYAAKRLDKAEESNSTANE